MMSHCKKLDRFSANYEFRFLWIVILQEQIFSMKWQLYFNRINRNKECSLIGLDLHCTKESPKWQTYIAPKSRSSDEKE